MTYVLLVMFISVTVSELSVDSIIIILYVNNGRATGGNHDNSTVSLFPLSSWDNEDAGAGPNWSKIALS